MTYDENVRDLVVILSDITDPRDKRGVRYRFVDLLLPCIYAVLAGYSEGTEIAFYVNLNFEYFKGITKLEQVPSHDTFGRVKQLLNYEKLAKSLGTWLVDAYPATYKKYEDKKVLHIDGKAIRAASGKSKGETPKYVLNSMYEGGSVGVEIQPVGDKGNEISCLPEYLGTFELKDTIVTIDAIGCNHTVIKTILDGGGDYVVPVKDNQKKLNRVIQEEIARLETEGKFKDLDRAEKLTKEHGRIEKMKASMISDTSFIYEKLGVKSFYGSIARIGVLDKEATKMGNEEAEPTKTRQIVITSLEMISIENLMNIKQAHWNIEMQHWLLDIQLNEDRMTARKENAMYNGGVLRRFCLVLREHDKEYADRPLKYFLMANRNDIKRIEKLLFGEIAGN